MHAPYHSPYYAQGCYEERSRNMRHTDAASEKLVTAQSLDKCFEECSNSLEIYDTTCNSFSFKYKPKNA